VGADRGGVLADEGPPGGSRVKDCAANQAGCSGLGYTCPVLRRGLVNEPALIMKSISAQSAVLRKLGADPYPHKEPWRQTFRFSGPGIPETSISGMRARTLHRSAYRPA